MLGVQLAQGCSRRGYTCSSVSSVSLCVWVPQAHMAGPPLPGVRGEGEQDVAPKVGAGVGDPPG